MFPSPNFDLVESPGEEVESKIFKCPQCEHSFSRKHNLKSHLLIHSTEKPFHCSICTLKFRRLHDLKRHEKLHTGEKPHQCKNCGRKFSRLDALVRHNNSQTGCNLLNEHSKNFTAPITNNQNNEKLPPINKLSLPNFEFDKEFENPYIKLLESRISLLENKLTLTEAKLSQLNYNYQKLNEAINSLNISK